MELSALGRLLIVAAVIIALLGLTLIILGQTPLGAWLRELPGTIRIQSGGFTCLVPIVASIILSLVLTVVLNIIIRMINRP